MPPLGCMQRRQIMICISSLCKMQRDHKIAWDMEVLCPYKVCSPCSNHIARWVTTWYFNKHAAIAQICFITSRNAEQQIRTFINLWIITAMFSGRANWPLISDAGISQLPFRKRWIKNKTKKMLSHHRQSPGSKVKQTNKQISTCFQNFSCHCWMNSRASSHLLDCERSEWLLFTFFWKPFTNDQVQTLWPQKRARCHS